MRTKYVIIPALLSMLAFSGTASATFQSINECVIDKFCTGPKDPACHFKWNKKFYSCMKYYDYHGKRFNYDWDYVRTKQAMKARIVDLKKLINQIESVKVKSKKDIKLQKKILRSLKNELEKRKQFKIIMKDPSKLP